MSPHPHSPILGILVHPLYPHVPSVPIPVVLVPPTSLYPYTGSPGAPAPIPGVLVGAQAAAGAVAGAAGDAGVGRGEATDGTEVALGQAGGGRARRDVVGGFSRAQVLGQKHEKTINTLKIAPRNPPTALNSPKSSPEAPPRCSMEVAEPSK